MKKNKPIVLTEDCVLKVSRHFKLSPKRVFTEAAKWCNYHDFPKVGRLWFVEWLASEHIHARARQYFKDVMQQCGLK